MPNQITWVLVPAPGHVNVPNQTFQNDAPDFSYRQTLGKGDAQTPNPILPKPVDPRMQPRSDENLTSVMLRNLPNNYTRSMLMDLFNNHGFSGEYDFLYLPMDFSQRACLGYAFVNLVSAAAARHFGEVFDGYSNWAIPSRKVSGVSWSHPHQGLKAYIERYQNSPVMHSGVPDEYKPVLLENGTRVDFPSPTRRIQHPRRRL